VVLASLSGASDSAKVTRLVSDLQQIETAMTMWMQGTGRVNWPRNDTGEQVPRGLSNLRNQTSLSDYLTTVPESPFGNGYNYDYNNTGMDFPCGGYSAGDVNIYVNNVGTSTIEKVDEIVDGGNESNPLNCGKVRLYNNSDLFYSLSGDGIL